MSPEEPSSAQSVSGPGYGSGYGGSGAFGGSDLEWRLNGNPVSDTFAEIDKLGFEPYVDAVCAFLTDRYTTPPLTMSVEGEWGSGKSSFMRQMRRRLERKGASGRVERTAQRMAPVASNGLEKQPRNLTFWFNAWRHDKQDQMWAAFALFLARELRGRRTFFERLRGDFVLANSRMTTVAAKVRAGTVLVLWLALLLGSVGLVRYTLHLKGPQLKHFVTRAVSFLPGAEKDGEKSSSPAVWNVLVERAATQNWVAALLVLGATWAWAEKHLGKRLEVKLEKYLDKPDYENRTSFIESFHEDFCRVIRAYRGKDKIFVFVDDLDRCDVPRAAELMQAINLMIGDNPIIFILGMDREKVAAGITLKFKDLLPYLRSSLDEGDTTSARHPSAFGYTYLEKFIQITFRVPRTSSEGIEVFLDSLSSGGAETEEQRQERRAARAERSRRRQLVEVVAGADSEKVEVLVRLVAPVLVWNPRRIKQFINMFRLQAYLCSDLGVLDLVADPQGQYRDLLMARLQLEQVGVFVAIGMTWPDLVMDLAGYPLLLQGVYATFDLMPTYPKDPIEKVLVERWRGERALLELLKETETSEYGWKYSLRGADLRMLMNIFPQEKRTEDAVSESESAVGAAAASEQAGPRTEAARSQNDPEPSSKVSAADFVSQSATAAPRQPREAQAQSIPR